MTGTCRGSTMAVQLEIFLPQHAGDVVALEEECGLEVWRAQDYARMLTTDTTFHGLVASLIENHVSSHSPTDENRHSRDLSFPRVVGFIAGRILPSEAEIYKLAVDRRCRRQGIASVMMKRFLGMAHERGALDCYLEVRCSNAGAVAFYESHGFAWQQTRALYYANPREDALVMVRRGEK